MSQKTDRRGQKSDDVEVALAGWEAIAEGPIEPPETVKLRDGDRRIWDDIVCARARDEWSAVDLLHAANLTRCLADIERLSAEIVVDGDTLTNERGTRCANPKHTLLEVLSRRAVALTRLLHLHAAVMQGRPRDSVVRREAESEARKAADELREEGDGLLATPTVQ